MWRWNRLLIVPYGIETQFRTSCPLKCYQLLIVPYGIETSLTNINTERPGLLIVPYGIETDEGYDGCGREELLIVPYGIETPKRVFRLSVTNAFNRTLWN